MLELGHSKLEKEKPPTESETMAEEINFENLLNTSGEGLLDTGKLKSVGTQKGFFQPASDGKLLMKLDILFKQCKLQLFVFV